MFGHSGFVSSAFAVMQRTGKRRLVIDMRPFNSYCEPLPVAYDDISALRPLFARKVSSFWSFDLQDGYHHFGIHPDYLKYFRWDLDGVVWES